MRRPRANQFREPSRFKKGPIVWNEVWRIARGPIIAFTLVVAIVYLLRQLGAG